MLIGALPSGLNSMAPRLGWSVESDVVYLAFPSR